jgi:hypothetical protein
MAPRKMINKILSEDVKPVEFSAASVDDSQLIVDEVDVLPSKRLKLSREDTILCETSTTASHTHCFMEDKIFDLGNAKTVKLTVWNNELRVDIRKYVNNMPTITGISLSVVSVRKLMNLMGDFIAAYDALLKTNAIVAKREYLGGHIFISLSNARPYIDIRRFFFPHDATDMLPTKRGICLSYNQSMLMVNILKELKSSLMFEEEAVCNHENIKSYFSCAKCCSWNKLESE